MDSFDRLSILPGEFGCKIVASEVVCPGNSSCASLAFTPKDREPFDIENYIEGK